MQFEAVPAGTAAGAALTLRGGDHSIEVPVVHSLHVSLGVALQSIDAAVAGRKVMPYSGVAGAVGGYFFTDDPAVLSLPIHANVHHSRSSSHLGGAALPPVPVTMPQGSHTLSRLAHLHLPPSLPFVIYGYPGCSCMSAHTPSI